MLAARLRGTLAGCAARLQRPSSSSASQARPPRATGAAASAARALYHGAAGPGGAGEEGRLFTENHEWLLLQQRPPPAEAAGKGAGEEGVGRIGRIGITAYAQRAIGDVVFVELCPVGTRLARGDAIGVVESLKGATDVHSPVAGTVLAVNAEALARPSHVSKDPEGKGKRPPLRTRRPADPARL